MEPTEAIIRGFTTTGASPYIVAGGRNGRGGGMTTLDDLRVLVREKRKERSWTQEKLAEMAGVSKNTIFLLETGKNDIYLYSLTRILTALGYEIKVEAEPTTVPPRREVFRY